MRPWLTATLALSLTACASRYHAVHRHGYTPYKAVYEAGAAPRLVFHARQAYVGDIDALAGIGGVLIGSVRGGGDFALRAGSLGATHYVVMRTEEHVRTVKGSAWVNMQCNGDACSGTVSQPSFSYPLRVHTVMLVRIDPARWDELPEALSIAATHAYDPSIEGDPVSLAMRTPAPAGCRYTQRDPFGGFDSHRLWVECADGTHRQVELEP